MDLCKRSIVHVLLIIIKRNITLQMRWYFRYLFSFFFCKHLRKEGHFMRLVMGTTNSQSCFTTNWKPSHKFASQHSFPSPPKGDSLDPFGFKFPSATCRWVLSRIPQHRIVALSVRLTQRFLSKHFTRFRAESAEVKDKVYVERKVWMHDCRHFQKFFTTLLERVQF